MTDQPSAGAPAHGILNIDKPVRLSSHDVVQIVRRAAHERRVGHAGTLDPLATGVLVVCVGAATRVIDEIQAGRKQYDARARLGVATSTYDAEGTITERHDIEGLTREQVEAALAAFRGEILQTPPMHSALKHHGRPLYELARSGVEIDRAPRPVTVYDLDVTEWAPPDVGLALTVSRGTYVRSLAHDLGQTLGVGAYLVGLVRTAVGPFTLAGADPLERVVAAFEQGWQEQVLYPLDEALTAYEAVVLSRADEAAVRRGQCLSLECPAGRGGRLRAYGESGSLVAVLAWHDQAATWHPERVFPREAGGAGSW